MKYFISILSLPLLLLLAIPVKATQYQLVAGAEPSTKIAELFFQSFSKDPVCRDYVFSVMEKSINHKGGILSSDKFLFGRTGRPLSSAEKTLGKEEILLGKVPIVFAKGLETQTDRISLKQLELILTRKITNWKQVGGISAPILLVGREKTDALLCALKKDYPFFNNIEFDIVFNKGSDVVKFLQSPAGATAISFGAKPNIPSYNLLTVDNLSSHSTLGLVFDLKNSENPVIIAAQKYARSAAWKNLLPILDSAPVN